MSVTGLGPLVVSGFLLGLTLAAVLLRLGRLKTPRSALAAAALPFALATLPVVALAVLSLTASWVAPDERALYAEVFGTGGPPMPDRERMLFEARGEGRQREILLRLDATTAEYARLTALPGLRPAAMTAEDFALRGVQRGAGGWWMRSTSPAAGKLVTGTECLHPAILSADGLNGWHEFRLAFCAGNETTTRTVFVAAFGR
ncbi:hypothetical protein [Novosphingobium soli]|uniref:Uncharacterized protein n=1 Tax=Novosphingobium soli TaxID=574956 RepID=A0ABV6CWQ8_9SPHN